MTPGKEDKKAKSPEKSNDSNSNKSTKTSKIDEEPDVKPSIHQRDVDLLMKDLKLACRLFTFTVVLFLSFATRFYNLGEPTLIW